MTLADLSLLANIQLASLQAIETGRSQNPSVHMIKTIADALGVKIDDLLKEPDDMYNNVNLAKDIYHMLEYIKKTQMRDSNFAPIDHYQRKIYDLSKAWALEAAQVTMKSLPKTIAIKALQDWLEKQKEEEETIDDS